MHIEYVSEMQLKFIRAVDFLNSLTVLISLRFQKLFAVAMRMAIDRVC